MGHTYRKLTEAECAKEIRAICGDDPGEMPADCPAEPSQKVQAPTQGDLL